MPDHIYLNQHSTSKNDLETLVDLAREDLINEYHNLIILIIDMKYEKGETTWDTSYLKFLDRAF